MSAKQKKFRSNPLESILIQKETEIKFFHSMVKCLKEMQSKASHHLSEHQSKADQKWIKVSANLSLFGTSGTKYSADRCQQLFYEWSKFYAQNYETLGSNLNKKSNKFFELLKIVHILDFSQFWSSYEWTRCLLELISHKIEIKDYLNEWQKCPSNEIMAIKEDKLSYLNDMSAKLMAERTDIEAFNLMVQIMESKSVYTKSGIKWQSISTNLATFDFSLHYSDIECRENFYNWTQFYAQNFKKLDTKLEPKSQEIFDLFKIVHILDVTKLWRPKDSTLSLLNEISNQMNSFITFKRVDNKRKLQTNNNKTTAKSVPKRHQNKDKESEIKKEIVSKRFQNVLKILKQELKEIRKQRKTVPQNLNTENEIFVDFSDMDLNPELLRGIHEYGMEKPSVIQTQAIYPCIKGRDVIVQAQSGTGKTAAFVISILQLIDPSLKECQALILTPTRVLVQQILKVMLELSKFIKIECIACIGGTDVNVDVRLLQKGAQVAVGTIGRVCDLIKRKAFDPNNLKVLVLDECDHLLNLNQWLFEKNDFHSSSRQIFEIFQMLNPKTQLFFSSTRIPPEIMKVSKWVMRKPIRILANNEELSLEEIKQYFVSTGYEDFKFDAFCNLYKSLSKRQSLVYCNTGESVDRLTQQLLSRDINVAHIHSDMEQRKYEDFLRGFGNGTYPMLLTSDALGKGINVQQVSLVVNYDLPQSFEKYIHRVGRSGRLGHKRIAITLVTNKEMKTLSQLEKFYNIHIEEMPTKFPKLI